MKSKKPLFTVCAIAFCVNLALFIVKLYIGLRSNSISIYSDAVNNLFDSVSGLITLVFMAAIVRKSGGSMNLAIDKSEQLFTLLIALCVTGAGFYFGYTALERFIYPTPVWFTAYYAVTISAAALVKAALFLIYGVFEKKSQSPVIRIMKFDCILDFFITLMTLITLFVSKNGTYSIDAVFGLIISIIITVTAIRQVISSAEILVNYVPSAVRDKVEEIYPGAKNEIIYITTPEGIEAFIKADVPGADTPASAEKCFIETGVKIHKFKGE
ncbi:MAG: cation transporter [Clostridia bacterium]|nr:cation transporter [Clostridia bacterium]